jgi:murein DD-endopeptidase MepM/ murein hydrolase activator NlpD
MERVFTKQAGLALIGCLALVLSGCGGSPDTYGSNNPSYRSSTAAKPARSSTIKAPARIKVMKGDTVYGIARKYGLNPREIISLNGLRAPYHLEIGQTLRLPVARTYTVVKGDTIYGISRRFGVDMAELTRANNIRAPYTLEIGDQLTLPPQTRKAVAVAPRRGSSATSKRKPSKQVAVAPPPSRSGNGFAWPLRGQVLSSFGPKKGGLHNDGINIAAQRGAAIKATDSGTIVYVGDELAGFGNLILVRHSGGWVSAYGHLSQVMVKRGETVKRGQTIGRAGSTGRVTRTQLHFELRKGSQAVDPKKYLPAA